MSDEPTDPTANEANDSEQQDSDLNDPTDTEEDEIALPDDLNQLIQGFLSSITADGNLTQSFAPYRPPPPVVASSDRALQNYLFQMQLVAGIPPHQIVPMLSAPPSRRGMGPVALLFRDDGCRIPIIPRVSFRGTLMPLFYQGHDPARTGSSTDGDIDGTTMGSPSSDSSGSFEIPQVSDDIEVYMDSDAQEEVDTQEDEDTEEDVNTQEDVDMQEEMDTQEDGNQQR